MMAFWNLFFVPHYYITCFNIVICRDRGSHDMTPVGYSDAYNSAIAIVRSVYSGPLVLDIPGWGQETDVAIAASPLISDNMIIFSAHIYPQSYNQVAGRFVVPRDVENLLVESGRPCIVGEFGDIQLESTSSLKNIGQCNVQAVVEAAKTVGYDAVYGWAWNGDGGSLNMMSPAWYDNPYAEAYTENSYFWSIMKLL